MIFVLYNKQMDNKYRSRLESRVADRLDGAWEYEACLIEYVQPEVKRKYTPDFSKVVGNKIYYIEAKGRFRTIAEAKKYLWIRDCLDPNEELIFVLQDKKSLMPGRASKSKVTGKRFSKETVEHWLIRKGFRVFTVGEFDENKL